MGIITKSKTEIEQFSTLRNVVANFCKNKFNLKKRALCQKMYPIK